MERGGDRFDADLAASALAWWADAGVDALVDEVPRDWLKPPKPTALPRADRPVEAPVLPPPVVDLPDQIELFQAYLKDAPGLPYSAPAAARVLPSGDPASDLMVLIDMPAVADCTEGRLLSGPAGSMFDRMLAAIGRSRETIYLAALSCFRAPDGRLSGEAAKACVGLARHHIALAKPKAVLIFGDAAAKGMTGQSVAQGRGRWHSIETAGGQTRALVTLSPEHLLARPQHKAHAWADLQLLMQDLGR